MQKAEETEVVQENKEGAGEEELVTASEEALKQDESGGYFKPNADGDRKKLKEYSDWKAGEKPGPNETVPVEGGLLRDIL